VTKSGEAQVHRQAVAPQEAPTDRDPTGHDRIRRHLLDPGDPLFGALGADADKRRQVDAFLRQLVAAAGRTIERVRGQGRPLRVVDLGCGNAYLTFAATATSAACCPAACGPSASTSGRTSSPGTHAWPTSSAWPGSSSRRHDRGRGPGGEVDVVLALHACDTATDDALARAVRGGPPSSSPHRAATTTSSVSSTRRAPRAAPPEPHAALVRHPILRERFADVLTDTLRSQLLRLAGYRVDVVEFVDSRHTPRNALLRAEHRDRWDGPPDEALMAEHRELAAAWHVRPRSRSGSSVCSP
jgi:hypothetical protein